MKRIVRGFRWVRSRIQGAIVVLGYHRVRNEVEDPFDLAVSPEHLAEHLSVIARRAHVIRLHDAAHALATGKMPPKSLVVTFDDGYVDTLTHVLPLLERHHIPATVFVTTGSPGRQFWWDELLEMVLRPEVLPRRLDLEIRGRRRTWLVPALSLKRRSFLLSLADALRPLKITERNRLLSDIRAWSGWRPRGTMPHRALTSEEIRRLAASPFIEIGAHTVSHPVLTSLTDDEQRSEIAESRATLKELSGQAVTSFSYPHGAYGAATIAAVRDAGFTLACCSAPDVITPTSKAYALPRLWVTPNNRNGFERWLDRWLVG